jgi:hypothetical protein
MKSKCCFCGKDYLTYPIFLIDDLENFLMEEHIKEMYYNNEKNEGVCEECRDKEFYKNPVWLIRNWLIIELQLIGKLGDFMLAKNEKMIKATNSALFRVKKIKKKLEKTPEVIELYHKNNPAEFKEPLINSPCVYCSDEEKVVMGEVWINNPNPDKLIKEGDECWWVCKSCRKVIELQTELTYASVFGDEKRALEINEKLDRIAKKIGKPIINCEISKENGKYKTSSVTFTGKKDE